MRRTDIVTVVGLAGSITAAATAAPGIFDLHGAFGSQDALAVQDAEQPTASDGSHYLLSDNNVFGDDTVWYTGFLTGMRATTNIAKRFADPVGHPYFFESPFIETSLRPIYLWHDFPTSSQISGGQANVWATQVRIALTDRLALIATKDGWTELNAGILERSSGWNDFTVGAKYAFIVDEAEEFVLTGGMRWEWHNGNRDVLQGGDSGDNELSPFISFAKAFGRWNLIGTVNGRLPMDHNDANFILNWDLHLDCEIAPETLPGLHPLIELHALHYLSNADRLPLSVGGLDYGNIGSSDVAGSSVFWGELGFRWKLTPNVSWGVAYGFPISNPSNDVFNQRVTTDFIFSF
ncbi:MAG: hypothetical protein HOP29_14715 [Phycisphaerales bacterium]|nr:hypothetical protein [Phycisphaerales bacterium]